MVDLPGLSLAENKAEEDSKLVEWLVFFYMRKLRSITLEAVSAKTKGGRPGKKYAKHSNTASPSLLHAWIRGNKRGNCKARRDKEIGETALFKSRLG
jgi:hypothetical protein